jgi:hypothetical protein
MSDERCVDRLQGMGPRGPAAACLEDPMLYAILCYNVESVVDDWPREKAEAVMAHRRSIAEKLRSEGRLSAFAKLMPTTAATTVRAGRVPVVLDGPFAETKEQLLGVHFVECASLEEAIEIASSLVVETGALEIRPVQAGFNLEATQ